MKKVLILFAFMASATMFTSCATGYGCYTSQDNYQEIKTQKVEQDLTCLSEAS